MKRSWLKKSILVALIFVILYISRKSIDEAIAVQMEIIFLPNDWESNASHATVSIPLMTEVEIMETIEEPMFEIQSNRDVNYTRAIVAISFGEEAAKSTIVERFVWSARHRGEFSGWIVLLTDAQPTRYYSISNWTDNFVVLHPDVDHFSKRHNHAEMMRKRFKTYVLQYIDLDSRLDAVKLVYYLDIDIVFGSPLYRLFDGLEEKHQIGRGHHELKEPARMWMFRGNRNWSIQGGQMILDRYTSRPCLDRWRYHMDHNLLERKDQVFLNLMMEEQQVGEESLQCRIVPMEQGQFIEFPEKREMVAIANAMKSSVNQTSGHVYSPLVHIRNTAGLTRMSKVNYHLYMQDVLGVKDDLIGITEKIVLK